MDRRPRSATLLTVTLAALCAPPSEAAERVLLVDTSSPSVAVALRERVLAGLVSGLGKDGLEATREAAPADELGGRIDRMLAEAKQLAQRFKEQEALERLDRAEQAFRAAAGRQLSIKPLTALLIARAKLEVDMGQGKAVHSTLERLAVLDPELTLDPGTFVPQLVRAFATLRRKVSRRKGRLRVTSTPSGLPVWIDGTKTEASTTPADLPLIAGEHFVAVGGRAGSRGKLVEIEASGTAEVRLTFDVPDDNRLRAAGKAAAAVWVVAVKVAPAGDKHRVSLRALSARTVGVAREVRSEPFAGGQATWALSKLSLAALPLLGRRQAPKKPPPPRPGGDDSLLSRWWFWTAVGAVVAAGAGVTTAVLLTRDRSVRLRLVP